MAFKEFNSEYGKVGISYQDGAIILEDKEDRFCQAEAEMIMQEYIDSIGEKGEVHINY